MCLATNGTLVDDEICKKIKEAGIKIVSLSLDGAEEAVHDDFRSQKGAFSGTIHAARLFKQYGIEFIINSSFTKRNQEEIPKVYKLAKELGATAWYLFMIVPTGRGEEIMNELISKEDYEKILEWHYQMEKDEDALLVRPTCAPHYYRIVLQKSKEKARNSKGGTLNSPPAGPRGALQDNLSHSSTLTAMYFPAVTSQSLRGISGHNRLRTYGKIPSFSRNLGTSKNIKANADRANM